VEFLFLLPLLCLGFALDAVTTAEAPADAADEPADTVAQDGDSGSLLDEDGDEASAAGDDPDKAPEAEAEPEETALEDPAPAQDAAEAGESHEWGAGTGPAVVQDFDPATDRVEIALPAAAQPQVELVPWGASGTLLKVNGEEAALFPNAAPEAFGPETLLWRAD
jgi:hypothetical protein